MRPETWEGVFLTIVLPPFALTQSGWLVAAS
jgi:hypothetical protein